MAELNNSQRKNIPVVILAGGVGIRIGKDLERIPKAMIDVNGIPILLCVMDHYAKYGFSKFIICAGYGKEVVEEFVKRIPAINTNLNINVKARGIDRSKWQIKVVDTGIENKTASRLALVRGIVSKSPFFCLTYGDTYSDINIDKLLQFHFSHRKTASLLAVHMPTRFRILGLYGDDPLLRGFSDKPILQNDYINGGFYVFNDSIFQLSSLNASVNNSLEIDILEELVAKKEICAYKYSKGIWQYIDNERNRKELCDIINS